MLHFFPCDMLPNQFQMRQTSTKSYSPFILFLNISKGVPYSKGMEKLLGSFAFRKDNKGWERSLQTNVKRTVVPEEGQRYRANNGAKAA